MSGNAAVEQDILFSYAPSYAASQGGEANAQVSFANVAAGVNYIYDQSGAGTHWHVAGYYQSYFDPVNWTSTGGMVGWLSSYNGNVVDVDNYADSVGADLLLYVVQNSDSSSIGGVTQQPGRYGVINPGGVWSAVTAHEIGGHAYGCNHQDGHINPKTIMMHNYCGGGSAPPYYFSSPNMWWNGVNMVGNGNTSCLGGSLVNGGDNTYCLSANAQGVTDRKLRVVYAPVLNNAIYHWSFTNAAGSAPALTTNYDLVSGAPAIVRGNGATYTGSALRIPGGTTGNVAMSTMAAYIDLPNGILSSQTNITIEIWATPLSAPNWARIMDFGNSSVGEIPGNPGDAAPGTTSQTGGVTLTASIGTDITQQRLEAWNNGLDYRLDSALATTAGVQHHYAITFTDGAGAYGSAGGRWQWYRDGDSVGYLDVSNNLASIQDVNEWLGRSEWSGDSLANNDYAEVRISNVAMNQRQVMANYLVGPNFVPRTTTLVASDLWNGSTRSFNTGGNWSDGLAPSAGKSYDAYDFNLTTPYTTSAYTFAGDSLHASGGIFFGGASGSSTITINKFQIDNEEICNAAPWYNTMTLAGNLFVTNNNIIRGSGGPVVVNANLNGNGSLTLYGQPVSLTGNNANFTGKVRIGNGIIGSLSLSSEAQLGANPPSFTADQLILNRGWLYTTTSFAVSNSNRGILIGVNNGIFDVAGGTTLTLGCPLSSGQTIISGNQLTTRANGGGVVAGVLIKQNSGTLALTSANPNFNGAISINAGTLSLAGAGQLGGGSFANPFTDNGVFDYSSSAAQTIYSALGGSGSITKNGSGTLTLAGANTVSGSVTINSGTLYANPGNAANNRAFSYVSGITINGGTLRAGPNGLFGWDGSQVKPITVNAGGTLTIDATGNDVNVGTVTLNGGTLAGGPSTAWGSWNFGRAAANNPGSGKLIVTANSTITANSLMFHDGAYIDVAAGKTLTIGGSLDDASSEGVCTLIKTNGAGTLVLSAANTYSGTTTVNAGTLLVNGSIGTNVVTVASGGTLGGGGTIGGVITLQSGSTLSPGNAGIGTFTAGNSVTLQAGSTSYFEINKSAGTCDKLIATGALIYGGTLTVVNLGGTLAAGDTFAMFQGGSYSGAFATFNLPTLAGGLSWNFDPANGTLSVTGSAPATPTGLVAIPGNAQVGLIWNTSSGATSYNVKRATVSGGPYLTITNVATTSYMDTAVVNGTTYYYVVSALNAGGESANSSQDSATPQPAVPPVPAGLTAARGNAQAMLSWTASTGATNYNVKRSTTSGGPYSTVGNTTSTSYTDIGLTNGMTYYYVVSAVNGGGESDNSSQVSIVPNDLVVWWKFDEGGGTTANDSSGGGIIAALQNSATWVQGIISNGIHLDGSANSYVVAPAGIVSTLTNFSVSTWVLVDTNATWARIFDFGSGTGTYMFLTPQSDGNTVRFAITTNSNGSDQQINSSTVLSPGIWHHVAVTLTNTVGILYVDGIAVGTNSSITLTPSSLGNTTQNYIGKSQWADPNLMGAVDDFRIYNRPLSAAEVATLAAAGLPSPWAEADIGVIGLAGTAAYTNGTYTIQAAGTNINGTVDALGFMYQTSSSDCSNTVRVSTMQNSGATAKAGVMIRESLNSNAREAGIWVTPTNGIIFTTRTSTGGSTSATTSTGKAAPYWVRIQRVSNSFRAYYSTNGTSWTQLGSSTTIKMSSNTYIGMWDPLESTCRHASLSIL